MAVGYRRAVSCLMFSLDDWKTQESHRVIADKGGFNSPPSAKFAPGACSTSMTRRKQCSVHVDVGK